MLIIGLIIKKYEKEKIYPTSTKLLSHAVYYNRKSEKDGCLAKMKSGKKNVR